MHYPGERENCTPVGNWFLPQVPGATYTQYGFNKYILSLSATNSPSPMTPKGRGHSPLAMKVIIASKEHWRIKPEPVSPQHQWQQNCLLSLLIGDHWTTIGVWKTIFCTCVVDRSAIEWIKRHELTGFTLPNVRHRQIPRRFNEAEGSEDGT